MSEKHVRILIPSDDPELSSERVWAVPHASIPHVYRVDNIPLGPWGIAYHDWVECTPAKRRQGNIPRFRCVYQPSGYGLVLARIDEIHPTRAPIFMTLLEALKTVDWPLESMSDTFWLLLAVPPGQTQAAETLFKQHPDVEFAWMIDALSHDTMEHPAALPMSIKTLTTAWKALTASFETSDYSPHDDLSEATRAALRQLGSLLDPLGKDE